MRGQRHQPDTADAPAGRSVALDVAVDAAHEDGAAEVAQRARHDGQAQAEHERVAKVEACLKEARHLRLHKEVVHRVQEHIPARGSVNSETRTSHVGTYGSGSRCKTPPQRALMRYQTAAKAWRPCCEGKP